ncbi:MAG: hypothetical protein WA615_29320 [Bradyrhizobium sp.]|uniref:hypothetical protein n=1 Tax=Bradyrhizobium sp. TaxID=376 RepID=UPI003C7A8860
MSDTSRQGGWTKPAAKAIPKGGFSKDEVEQGRYGPIFAKTPACYGFSIIAKVIPGRESAFYEHAKTIEKAVANQPDVLAVLKLHYLRFERPRAYHSNPLQSRRLISSPSPRRSRL